MACAPGRSETRLRGCLGLGQLMSQMQLRKLTLTRPLNQVQQPRSSCLASHLSI